MQAHLPHNVSFTTMDASSCEKLHLQNLTSPNEDRPMSDCLLSDSASSASSGPIEMAPIALKTMAPIQQETKDRATNSAEQDAISDDDDDDDDDEDDDDAEQDTLEHQSDLSKPHRAMVELASTIEQSSQHRNHQHHQQHQQQQQQQHWQHRHKEFQRDLDDVKQVELFGVRIVALTINGKDRLCLAQISNTLLKEFSYNEIHNRRVALGITCIQCTPIQLEMLRRAGAMPSSSRRCGMITMREAERLCRSFLVEEQPPELPENFYFTVAHRVNYGCRGRFVPARYISSRAKCIECFYCGEFYSPNKFIFHSHRQPNNTDCNPPDSPNINSWRKHIDLDWTHEQGQEIRYAWEDVKSLFNGGTRRRAQPQQSSSSTLATAAAASPTTKATSTRSIGQRKSAIIAQPSPVNRLGRFGAPATPANLNNRAENDHDDEDDDDDEQDHIDVVRDEIEPRPSKLSEQPNVRVHNCDESGKPGARTAMQQQRVSGSGKRSLSAAGRGSMPSSYGKRSTANHPYRHQSSILGEPQAPDIISYSHNVGRSPTGGFVPLSVANRAAVTNHSRTGAGPISGQFDGIDFSSSATTAASAASRRPTEKAMNLGSQYSCGSSSNNPLMIAPDTNFIHSQLYSQLMQPQLQQQSLQGLPEAVDAQMALRHHLWTSLLANLQCNFPTNNHQQIYQQQQQQPTGATRMSDISVANTTRPGIGHLLASYPQIGASKLHSTNAQAEINLDSYKASQ